MSTVNYHTSRSSNLAALNAIVLNVSTLTGSTIQTTATATTSSIVVSTLTTQSATYSTLTGSTITTSSIITPVIATATGSMTIGQNTNFPNRSIEIGSDAANSVYFDFHSSDAAVPDYSTRIQSLGGSTIGQGQMLMYASTIGIFGTSGVGIGTTNPATAFHVYGASSPAIGMGNSTAANFFQIGAASFVGSYSASAVAGDAIIRTTSGNLMLQTGTGAAAVYVNTSNNIILNYNASSPSTYKLCVEQGLSNNNGILISNSNYGSAQQFQLSMVNAGSGNFYSYAMIQTNTAGVAGAVPLCLQPNSANVGIGTTAPTGKCHIYGAGQSTGTSDLYSLNVSSSDSFNGNGGITVFSESINLKAGDLTWANYGVRVYGARIYVGGGYSINAAQNQGYISMFTGNTERVRVSDAGYVGVGITTPVASLHVYGTGTNSAGQNTAVCITNSGNGKRWDVGPNSGAGDFVIFYNNAGAWLNNVNPAAGWNLQSDLRLKDDIVSINNCVDTIDALRPVSYRMKSNMDSQYKTFGLIAQEVKEVLPELIQSIPDVEHGETYGITYNGFIPILIGAVKELSKKNTALEEQLATILARLAAAGIA